MNENEIALKECLNVERDIDTNFDELFDELPDSDLGRYELETD